MNSKMIITWLAKPEDHDYAAAASYLELLYDKKMVKGIVDKLMKSPMTGFKSKDIFRASSLPLLSIENSHVLKDKKRIASKQKLSPILLVRDTANRKVIIADGYHRMCAVYYYDEDAVIPCQII